MKTNNQNSESSSKLKAKTSLKSRIGLIFIVTGFISPLFALGIPLLNLSTSLTAGLVTLFLVGVPEVFLIVGAALAGKEGMTLVKNKIKRFLGLPEGTYAAPKSQYALAKVFLIFWLITVILPYYAPALISMPVIENNLLYISIGGDILLIVAIFFLGGNQMVTKIAKLFTWEPWTLPEKTAKIIKTN